MSKTRESDGFKKQRMLEMEFVENVRNSCADYQEGHVSSSDFIEEIMCFYEKYPLPKE